MVGTKQSMSETPSLEEKKEMLERLKFERIRHESMSRFFYRLEIKLFTEIKKEEEEQSNK